MGGYESGYFTYRHIYSSIVCVHGYFEVSFPRNNKYLKSIVSTGPRMWSELPNAITAAENTRIFKNKLQNITCKNSRARK